MQWTILHFEPNEQTSLLTAFMLLFCVYSLPKKEEISSIKINLRDHQGHERTHKATGYSPLETKAGLEE